MSNRNQEFLCVLCCALATKTLNAWLVLTPAQLLAFFRGKSVNRWGWTSKPDCHSGSTEDSLKILYEGRAGEMYGYEPTE